MIPDKAAIPEDLLRWLRMLADGWAMTEGMNSWKNDGTWISKGEGVVERVRVPYGSAFGLYRRGLVEKSEKYPVRTWRLSEKGREAAKIATVKEAE